MTKRSEYAAMKGKSAHSIRLAAARRGSPTAPTAASICFGSRANSSFSIGSETAPRSRKATHLSSSGSAPRHEAASEPTHAAPAVSAMATKAAGWRAVKPALHPRGMRLGERQCHLS